MRLDHLLSKESRIFVLCVLMLIVLCVLMLKKNKRIETAIMRRIFPLRQGADGQTERSVPKYVSTGLTGQRRSMSGKRQAFMGD